MPERKWLPHKFQDEVIPPPMAHPSDWIIGSRGDVWEIGDPADQAGPEMRLRVLPGDFVEFDWVETFSDVELRVGPDGAWSSHPDPDPRAEQFCTGDPSTLSTSLDELAAAVAEMMTLPAEVGVSCYRWGGPVPHRLVVDERGARFVEVEKND